jgi:enoyl-CoA hydratase
MAPVEITQHGPVTVITINRAERRNAINRKTADALREAWLNFDADDSQRVGVLTGGVDIFCAGADLKEIESLSNADESGPLGHTRFFISKPTIAAVAGYAVAGGLELACWCDLRIADESAVFGCFERRFGVPLIDGGTQRLPQIVGLGRALELILTGRPVNAQEALTMGLANEVVPRGMHIRRAIEIGKMLADFPQAAMLNDRQAVYRGLGETIEAGLKIEAELGQQTLDSGESYAGADEFAKGAGRSGKFDE